MFPEKKSRETSGLEGKRNLFPEGPYFKCLTCGIQQILQSDWFRELAES